MTEVPSDETIRKGVKDSLAFWVKKLECGGDVEKQWFYKKKFIEKLKASEIAIETDKANEQHYEVPTEFYLTILGKRLKYSGCSWPEGAKTIEEAEDASLAELCERARVEDGQTIMDLGCGWGALALYICEKYPKCQVTTVSNSNTQRDLIQTRAKEAGWTDRLQAITANVKSFDTDAKFDRIISIEMFEHMKNYEKLLEKVSGWMKPDGYLFTQILCHREFCYSFDVKTGGATDWMARHFFSGGTMPSADLFLHFQNDVCLVEHWRMNGKTYSRTLEAWLRRLDENEAKVKDIMNSTYGEEGPENFSNWRMFFMFCSETFGYKDGNDWIVAQHLFKNRSVTHA